MLIPIARKIPFALAVTALVGCSSSVEYGNAGGGNAGAGGSDVTSGSGNPTGGPTTTTGSSGPTTTGSSGPTTTTGSGPWSFACSGPNSAGPAAACTPQDPGCNPGKSVCAAVEVVDGAPAFNLRMAHLQFSKPSAFTSGIAKSLLGNWFGPTPPVCHIPNFLLAWILRFDLGAGTLVTGGAVEGAGQAPGFQFINVTVPTNPGTAVVQPVTAPLAWTGCDLDVAMGDVNMPIQYDPGFASTVYLPFRNLRFHGGQVSPDHNCIGVYNDALLSPGNSCAPTDSVPAYADGAQIEAVFPLEDADQSIISPLSQSLCVFLSQDSNQFGTQDGQYTRCKRYANNEIVFKGDWCAATNQPATPACADALHVVATFAASGVKWSN